MAYTSTEQKGLREALALLETGASSAFEYQLWVTFGDGWIPRRSDLAAEGAIRPATAGEWTITPAGEALRRSLEEGQALSGSISGGEPGRDAPCGVRAGRPRAAVEGSSVV